MTTCLPPQILVVDDVEPIRRIYGSLFDQIGLEPPDIASNADDAFRMICSREYAVVISDWNMVGPTGLHLLRQVRSRLASSTLPFIMATAESGPERMRAAWDAGVTDYLVKPFNVGALKVALAKASARIAAEMEAPLLA